MKARDAGGVRHGEEFPYEQARPGQLEAARALAESVKRGEAFILSAPTGFGKTVTVLYGLKLAGVERVLYVVRTRNEIEPVLREVERMGVESFSILYSARRMCPLLSHEKLSVEDFWETCRLLRLRGECLYYNNYTETSEETVKAIISAVKPRKPRNIVSSLVSAGLCPFFSLRLASLDAWIVVATYPYLFREDIFSTVFEPLTYADFVVVVDEAHSLLNIQTMLEQQLSQEIIAAAEAEVERYGLPSELAEKLAKLRAIIRKSKPSGEGYWRVDKKQILSIIGDPQVWIDAAHEVRMAKLKERLEGKSSVKLSVALSRVAAFAQLVHADYTGVYIKSNGKRVLSVLPLEPAAITAKPLNEARAVVLLSGTMPPSTLVRDVLGLAKPLRIYEVELLHGAIFPRSHMKVVVTLELTSRATSRTEAMYRKYSDYIVSLYNCVRNSVLAVYPSYEFMNRILGFILQSLDREEVIVEDKNTHVEDVVQKVREKRHVLINAVAGGKLTEGIEFTANGSSMLSAVFIAGVPYPRPDHYTEDMLDAIAKRTGESKAKSFIYDYMASLRTRQAIGRARRSPEDRAIIVLGDSRFLRKTLRSYMKTPIDSIAGDYSEYKETICMYARQLDI